MHHKKIKECLEEAFISGYKSHIDDKDDCIDGIMKRIVSHKIKSKHNTGLGDLLGDHVLISSTYDVLHELHSIDDCPALEYDNGTKIWHNHGKKHRLEGPAVITMCGKQEWWQNDRLHRFPGPAVINSNGDLEWWRDGKRHRYNGP